MPDSPGKTVVELQAIIHFAYTMFYSRYWSEITARSYTLPVRLARFTMLYNLIHTALDLRLWTRVQSESARASAHRPSAHSGEHNTLNGGMNQPMVTRCDLCSKKLFSESSVLLIQSLVREYTESANSSAITPRHWYTHTRLQYVVPCSAPYWISTDTDWSRIEEFQSSVPRIVVVILASLYT